MPGATLVATPKFPEFVPTAATAVSVELHATTLETSCVDESLKVPVAVNVLRAPVGIVGFAGVMITEEMVALLTLKGTEALIDPKVAVMSTDPGATPFPSPLMDPTLSTVGADDDHVTTWVTSWVLPSLKVPVALNAICVPCGIVPFAGVIAMEFTFAALTVTEVPPVTPPKIAVMFELPTPSPVASPLTVIEAIPDADECHCATFVTSCVLPSEKVPVAVNCWDSPSVRVGLCG